MKTATECFHHAAKCEELATEARDEASRSAMVATSGEWRLLGEAAKAREAREVPSPPQVALGPESGEPDQGPQGDPEAAPQGRPRGKPRGAPRRRGRRILGLL